MRAFLYFISCLILSTLLLPFMYAQMPEWQPFKDRAGNLYFFDRAGKIFITDEAAYPDRTVSPDGVEYYYHLAAECIRTGNYTDGLSLLKAIQYLTDRDERIRGFREKASRDITYLQMKHGTRFDEMNRNACPVVYKENGIITLVNEPMDYSICCQGELNVLRINRRFDGKSELYGMTLGLSAKAKEKGYDCLLAIETEKDHIIWRNLQEVEEKFRFRQGSDMLKREQIARTASRVVYSFTMHGKPDISGFECITWSGRSAHIARIIAPSGSFGAMRPFMEKVVNDFKLVGR